MQVFWNESFSVDFFYKVQKLRGMPSFVRALRGLISHKAIVSLCEYFVISVFTHNLLNSWQRNNALVVVTERELSGNILKKFKICK
jgi:hypothetical protein